MLAFLQPLDSVLALVLALIGAAIIGGGALIFIRRRYAEDEVDRVTRQSWAIGTVAVVVCLMCIATFFVLLELLAAASTS